MTSAICRAALVCVIAAEIVLMTQTSVLAENEHGIAVIIGNRSYQGSIPNVDFAANDAAAMREFVKDILGFREGNIIDLRDATFGELVNVFGSQSSPGGRLASWIDSGKSDVVVFYSGHGVPWPRTPGSVARGYLLPSDGNPNNKDTLYSLDLLREILASIGARSVALYVDACFSGNSAAGTVLSISATFETVPLDVAEITTVMAAKSDQVAYWDRGTRHGLFTRYLIEGLRGAADRDGFGNGDRKVTAAELQQWLDREMTYHARRDFGDQNATLRTFDAGVILADLPPIPEVTLTARVSVRASPSVDADQLAILEPGELVKVLGDHDYWAQIEMPDGRTGFVVESLLSPQVPPTEPEPADIVAAIQPAAISAPEQPPVPAIERTMYATSDVIVRASPSTSAALVAILKSGAPVLVKGTESYWFRVLLAGGQLGYVLDTLLADSPADDLAIGGPAPPPVPTTVVAPPALIAPPGLDGLDLEQRIEAVLVPEVAVPRVAAERSARDPAVTQMDEVLDAVLFVRDADIVNVRNRPSIQADRILQVARGDQVRVTGRQGNWFRVTLADGQTGFIFERYLGARDNVTELAPQP